MADSTKTPETDFLASYDSRAFEPLAVAVDVALVTAADGALLTLLTERNEHPFAGHWALPGVFVKPDEGLGAAALRALAGKVGVSGVFVEQLYSFGSPARDPRMRVVTIAHYALVDHARFVAAERENDNVRIARLDVPWEGETGGPVDVLVADGRVALAFDHADVLGMVVKRMRGKLDYSPIGFQLLPNDFTLRQLLRVHETVLGRALNKDSFRRRMLGSGQLEATGERQVDVGHRPAEKYRFVRRSAI
jgi:ADP-ribose pyrophosphatase YjhB (NUDIX family)